MENNKAVIFGSNLMAFNEQEADGEGAEITYTSNDFKRMVVHEWTLYALTHVNEDDVLQYKIVGITGSQLEAERFIAGDPAKYLRVAEQKPSRQ